MTDPSWHDKTQTERHADIIDAKERQIRAQVNTIGRLLSAVRMSEVPVGGTVVRFKLEQEALGTLMAYGSTQAIPYLEIAESTVDVEGGVIITLKVAGS